VSLRVLHATDRYAVIDKPSGLLSVPGIGPHKADCVIARVAAMFPHARGPMMVHRLDMETSGLIVVALDPDAQRDLSAQFEARSVTKRYLALLVGTPPAREGQVAVPIRLDVERRPYQIADFERGRPALTGYRVLSQDGPFARVEFTPLTGRTHQIRVHAALPPLIDGRPGGLGCPVAGDPLYGEAGSYPRLALHAAYLAFAEPGSGIPLEFSSTPPF
jgi:tRNA pseudouridine32 synthase / 23S rRNA pseudouridine746 synthase